MKYYQYITILFVSLSAAFSFHTTAQAQENTASIQIIHNSADPAVAEVDIYVNGDLFLSEVPFRGATGFVELDTEVSYDIVVTPAGASINDGFSFEGIQLEDGESYYVVATGVATPGDFAANPNDVNTGFFLDIIPGASAEAGESGNVDFKIYHGATDAPAVDVIARGFLDPSVNQDGESFALIAVLADGNVAVFEPIVEEQETASVQVIHNAADPALAEVDVYVNGDLFATNFPFRGATEYLTVPANEELLLEITAPGSTDVLLQLAATPVADQVLAVIAQGVADPSGFAPNPSGESIGAELVVLDEREVGAPDEDTFSFYVFHGATDAPAVDIFVQELDANILTDVPYGTGSGYFDVPEGSYAIEVRPAGSSEAVAVFIADAEGLGGLSAGILASGFLSPEDNQNGEGFALIVVLENGIVVTLEAEGSVEPIGDNLIFNGDFDSGLDNWTPFIADFAGVSADIDVADGEASITNISGAGGEVWYVQLNQEFTQEQIEALEVGQTYKAQFDARSNTEGRQLRLFFGEDGGGFAPVNISDFSLTTSMETYEVTFEVGATYGAMKFGFEMGLANDDVFIDNVSLTQSEAEPTGLAQIQIIHNSADPAVAEVDIYVNGDMFLPNVPFRGATGFVELDVDITYDIVVTPAGASIEDGFSFEGIELEDGESYYVVASGVASPDNFASNPDGVNTGFFLDIIPGAKLAADDSETVEFIAYHGATDAPAVDVIARDVAALEEGLTYTDYSAMYIAVPADSYVLDINVAGTETTAASFTADLSMLGGGAAIVLASGFLDPAVNQDGPAFTLIAVLPDGTVATFEPFVNIEDPSIDAPKSFALNQNYPNPFNPTTNISYTLPEAGAVTLEVFNMQGQRVAVLVNGTQNAGSHTVSFDAGRLASGVYLYRLQSGSFSQVQKMMLVK